MEVNENYTFNLFFEIHKDKYPFLALKKKSIMVYSCVLFLLISEVIVILDELSLLRCKVRGEQKKLKN